MYIFMYVCQAGCIISLLLLNEIVYYYLTKHIDVDMHVTLSLTK